MDEQAVLNLRSKRTTLKSKLTAQCKQLLSNSGIDIDIPIKPLFLAIQSTYSSLLEVHFEFAEYVESDEFAKFAKVNNLDPDQYYDRVNACYNEAITHYRSIQDKILAFSNDIGKAISHAKVLCSSTFTPSNHEALSNDISEHIDRCQSFKVDPVFHNIANHDAFVREINDLITKLQYVIDSKSSVSLSSASDLGSQPQNVTPSSQQSLQASARPDTGGGGSGLELSAPREVSNQSHSGTSNQTNASPTDGSSDIHGNHGRPQPNTLGNLVPQSHGTPNTAYRGASRNGTFHTRELSHSYDMHNTVSCNSVVSAYDNMPSGSVHLASVDSHVASNNSYMSSTRPKLLQPKPFSGEWKQWPEFRSIWFRYASLEYSNDFDRAVALKNSLQGDAFLCVESITVTQPKAYARILSKLEQIYSNPSMCVQSVLDDLRHLKSFSENDLQGLVKFVSTIELAYSQLGEVGHIHSISMNQVDDLADLIPMPLRKEWMKRSSRLSKEEEIRPLRHFMIFLEEERDGILRLAERERMKAKANHTSPGISKAKARAFHTEVQSSEQSKVYKAKQSSILCVIHKSKLHSIEECRNFLAMDIDTRYNLLKTNSLCTRCFGSHAFKSCSSKKACDHCGKSHHSLLCKNKSDNKTVENHKSSQLNKVTASSNHGSVDKGQGSAVFAIQQAQVYASKHTAILFFDGGSDTTFISHRAAKAWGARRIGCEFDLELRTLGVHTSTELSLQYEVKLLTESQDVVTFIAYGMKDLTNIVNSLDKEVLEKLFPNIDVNLLIKTSGSVDLLIGNNYLGYHPKKEVATAGEHLSVMKGIFGYCVHGSHPDLQHNTDMPQSLSAHITARCNHVANFTIPHHPEYKSSNVFIAKAERSSLGEFIKGEELGIQVHPQCGSCRCGKCPVKGHTYSFQEEQELQMIRSNLKYDKEKKRWTTSYPWIIDPNTLPDNYSSALATLKSTEKVLKRDESWGLTYSDQIKDMIDRDVARKLTKQELKGWQGPKYYISHLAVLNPKSTSTPVRIVFNSSQLHNGTSLNNCLAKGPDSYLNNLLGIIIRWRENEVALVGDIKKMYNSIFINEVEQHTHRFLWRDLEDRAPDTYIIQRVNMGDRPAAAISSEAIYLTADHAKEQYPRVQQLLKYSTYVDDIVDSFSSSEVAEDVACETEQVLQSAGFKVKCWLIGGENGKRVHATSLPEASDCTLQTQVLGVHWIPSTDRITFHTNLNFSVKKKGVYTQPDITPEQLTMSLPVSLTRRTVLEQTMKIYDPLGFLCPFTFQAKLLLRQTWTNELGWDDALPADMTLKWNKFFTHLFDLPKLQYDRCLKPSSAIGSPILVIFSDASEEAYGFCAYARWELTDGSFQSRLIMAKCRIAPLKRLSMPQMELNGAVLSKRGRQVIETESRLKFSKIYQLVDSDTVLCMLRKKSIRFKLYEGVRIAEIQGVDDGDVSTWFWIQGSLNIADWLTRGKSLSQIDQDSQWWNGPDFLSLPEDQWPIKSEVKTQGSLPGEKKLVHTVQAHLGIESLVDYTRFPTLRTLLRTIARVVLFISNLKSVCFKNGDTKSDISVQDLQAAKIILVNIIQRNMETDLTSSGKYAKLHPLKTAVGVWVIGSRLSRHNPMAGIKSDLPMLLPTSHAFTRLAMRQAHIKTWHRGRDATLARFRTEFWIPHGTKVARAIVEDCNMCKLKKAKLLEQQMGKLPLQRLTTGPPFNFVMLDLFGPFPIKGEVQRRISGKGYGIIFTDLCSRAVHVDGVFGYDTESFLLALRRFVNIRGWPAEVFSDPGTQLIGAGKELQDAWMKIDKSQLKDLSVSNGTQWTYGPGDSPWYQGAAEALIGTIKKCFHFSMDNKKLSASEFITACTEVANILNERPLGVLPGNDSDISVLTPNCQLIGRPYAQNPGGWSLETSLKARLQLITAISDDFWRKWNELYVPTLTRQQKWFGVQRNLQVGDIVLVSDSNVLKHEYKLARVHETFPSKDGIVRKVALIYKNFKVGSKVTDYKPCKDTIITRSVHRLALLTEVSG